MCLTELLSAFRVQRSRLFFCRGGGGGRNNVNWPESHLSVVRLCVLQRAFIPCSYNEISNKDLEGTNKHKNHIFFFVSHRLLQGLGQAISTTAQNYTKTKCLVFDPSNFCVFDGERKSILWIAVSETKLSAIRLCKSTDEWTAIKAGMASRSYGRRRHALHAQVIWRRPHNCAGGVI